METVGEHEGRSAPLGTSPGASDGEGGRRGDGRAGLGDGDFWGVHSSSSRSRWAEPRRSGTVQPEAMAKRRARARVPSNVLIRCKGEAGGGGGSKKERF